MHNSGPEQDTITAIATASGKGGIGIVRLSGPRALEIGQHICQTSLKPRYAHYGSFYQTCNPDPVVLDQGIALYFKAPHSFTGEDVVELQGHGGPVIMDLLLRKTLQLGARLAAPGEFSQRAYLNDKMDLTQAEAVADLIDSASEQAALSALRSLSGEFSQAIHQLSEQIISLRMYVEAAIDFPEEEIDFLSDGHVATQLDNIIQQLQQVFAQAKQGQLLQEGMTVVIAGRPNAGKSSLLNALAGYEAAIVTDIEGTTRDVLREHIQIDGMPLHIVDTAGLRESPDAVEQEGIRRAWAEIDNADEILLIVDSQSVPTATPEAIWPEFVAKLQDQQKVTIVRNKSDLSGEPAGETTLASGHSQITLSAKHADTVNLLRHHLKQKMGFKDHAQGSFTARRRHLNALEQAETLLFTGREQLKAYQAGELLAEDLRQAQQHLNEITGEFTTDDLLGKIFSSFCIGK